MDYVVYLCYPILCALFFWGTKLCKPKAWNDSAMSYEQSKAVQGFAIVLIMFHHMSQKTCVSWIPTYVYRPGLEAFVNVGYLCVGFFFFYSGYGLYKSLKSKQNYLTGFISKRVMQIVVALLVSNVIYLVARFLMKQKMDIKEILAYLIGIKQTNPNGWYLIVLPLLYLIFYVCFKYIKSDNVAIIVLCMSVFVYTIIGTAINHNDWIMCGEWWYNSVHLFPIGIIFAKNEQKISDFVKKYYVLLLIFCIFMIFTSCFFAGLSIRTFSYYYGEYMPKKVPVFDAMWRRWICLVAQILTSSFVVMFVYLMSLKVKIGNKALEFLGSQTLWIYIIHGLYVELFGFSFIDVADPLYYIKNVFLYVVVVCVLSIPSAMVLSHLQCCIKIGNDR